MCIRRRKQLNLYDIGKAPKVGEGHPGVEAEVRALPSSLLLPVILKDTINASLKDGPFKTRAGKTQAFFLSKLISN